MLNAHNEGMSDTTPHAPITIASEEDYRAVQEAQREAVTEILQRATAEGWTVEERIAPLAEVILPYRRAMTDPANREAEAIRRDDRLQQFGTRATLLSRDEYPELYAERDRQVAELNAAHNVTYEAPPIYIIEQLRESDGSSLAYSHGLVMIDADFLQSAPPTQSIAGPLGHELYHRYERADDVLKARITLELENNAGILNSEIALHTIREEEARADLTAARLTSPRAMADGLERATAQSTLTRAVTIYFQQSRGIVDDGEAINRFNRLTQEEREHLYASYNQLPQAQRTAIEQEITQSRNAMEPFSEHPSMPHRIEMLRMLEAHPEILSCKSVEFDGSANIIEATSCGPDSVPLVVDGVPTSSRARQ